MNSATATPQQVESGFSLIELLVVLVVLATLAALALPAFVGQSDKAKDADAKSDVRNALVQVESCQVPAAALTTCLDQVHAEFPAVTGTDLSAGTPGSYRLTASSAAGAGHFYAITQRGDSQGYLFTAGPDATGRSAWEGNSGS